MFISRANSWMRNGPAALAVTANVSDVVRLEFDDNAVIPR